MPASTFSNVLLPAPLWPMTPSRSPLEISRVKSCRALTFTKGLTVRRNMHFTTYSLKVMRWRCRTRKVKQTRSIEIRAMVHPTARK